MFYAIFHAAMLSFCQHAAMLMILYAVAAAIRLRHYFRLPLFSFADFILLF